jgi:hypothetical protein
MKFSAQSKVTTLSASAVLISISGNNINNILLSALGTTVPTGYKEWQGFYDAFEVIESRINVKLVNLDAAESCQIVCFPQLNSTTSLSLAEAVTQKFSKHGLVGHANGMGSTSFSHLIKTQSIFGAKRTETSPFISNYLIANSPIKQWFWNVTIGNPDTLGSSGIVSTLKIDLTYKVRLQQRKILRNLTLPSALFLPRLQEEEKESDSEYDEIPVGIYTQEQNRFISVPKSTKSKRRSMLPVKSIHN